MKYLERKLKYEFERDGEFTAGIRDMAYEVITKQLKLTEHRSS
jgi:hypothetical protein